jgi:hypothetical protein
MIRLPIYLSLLFVSTQILAQEVIIPAGDEDDYYYQIPGYPENFDGPAVAARMIDALGFRYYWATEGLREVDLSFSPSEKARTSAQTIDHILDLTHITLYAVRGEVAPAIDKSNMSLAEKRNLALRNLMEASEILKGADGKAMEEMEIIFARQDGSSSKFPFWNAINGPIADAIHHTGQIISFRRSSGNPINPNISVFSGTVISR